MKEISVIGATSPLGINLVELLAEKGAQIYAGYRSEALVPQAWRDHPLITGRKLDLSEEQPDLTGFCARTVVWLAHLEQGRFNDHESAVNLAPFENFLAQAKAARTEKIVFVSSGGAVYGEPLFLPITEDHPRNPLSSYGKAKRAMEERLSEFNRETNIKTAVIRPGNIYGFENPQRESKGIVGTFLKSIKNHAPFTLIHRGQTVRDFVHVRDVSRAVATAIESPQKEIVWNVATGEGHRIAEIMELILKKSGFEPPPVNHIENFSSDVSANILSIKRITSESEWRPLTGLEAGLEKTIENWRRAENSRSQRI